MATRLDELMERLREVEGQIETEIVRQREALRYRLENRRIIFEEDVLRFQRAIKVRLSQYIRNANPWIVITAPVIYSLIIPFVLLDLFVMAYQAICFPVYKIPKVRRRDYLVFDRHHLAYLNLLEKINCAYCSYGNGAIAFAREVAARTEAYWCPIKHARRVLGPHPHYQGFADFGDAEAFRGKIDELKDGLKIDGAG
ncbi:hypothetical protein [Rhodopseudomonas sp. BAL398]|nr:hypothetical protein [Rhodopseudomonas sp. BAL398]MDF3814517.1 hypothetical protein [Rhodopseudomonas sp. BAL398]WOK16030.1 hypothetical protein RBJ75_17885 [Rhodopseudomonas sp. BAL398]